MKSVITGGAGFIGSHLADALIERGDQVLVIDNLVGTGDSTRNIAHLLEHPRFSFVKGDVAAIDELPDCHVVFHLAASKATVCMADPERDLRTNALGTLRIAQAAIDAGATLVHASTGSVMDGHPASFYGTSKGAGENYVRLIGEQTNLPWTALRYFHVIGPRQSDADTGGVVPIFLRRARAGLPLVVEGTGTQVRSFTSVHDVVRATLAVAERPQRRVLDCASGIRVSIAELAAFVRTEFGPVPVVAGPRRSGDVDEFHPDNRVLRELGIDFDQDWQGMVRAMVPMAVAA
jgi:nucleoside-diphosphate-sugar epimerase